MIGKIIGTSLAGILQFFIWALIGFSLLFAASVFGANVGPTARSLRINGTGAEICRYRPNVYQGIMEFTNSEYTNKFYSLFHSGYFLYSSFCAAMVPLLIKPTHNNFSYPLLCLS
jgi:ABC-2 type transport system permease protein